MCEDTIFYTSIIFYFAIYNLRSKIKLKSLIDYQIIRILVVCPPIRYTALANGKTVLIEFQRRQIILRIFGLCFHS